MHVRPEDLVPRHEEGLREVEPAAAQLVVHVVVRRVVPEAEVEHVPRQPETAMVVHALHRAEREEEDGGARRHAGGEEGERAAERVEEEALGGVVVLRAERVGHDEVVVPRVDVPVQEPVQVHVPVPRVLPPVQHGHGHRELPCQLQERRRRAAAHAILRRRRRDAAAISR